MSGRRRIGLVIGSWAVILSSCSSVTTNDLVGTWAMSEQSRSYLGAEVRVASPTLTLNSDATFTVVDLPALRELSSASADISRSGRGRWSILQTSNHERLELFFDQGPGDELFISDWSSDGPWSSTTLYYFIGDPDSGRRIQFVRR